MEVKRNDGQAIDRTKGILVCGLSPPNGGKVKMNKSETIGKLAGALATVQAQLQRAPENAKNPFFKSNYADLGSVWDTCRQLLADNGLSVVQMPSTPPVEFLPAVSLTTVLMHESGEWISDTVTSPIAKSDPQGVGSALTYMRRYALAAMVGIVTGDDDGNGASGNQAQPTSKPTRKQPLPSNGDARGNESPQAQAQRAPDWSEVSPPMTDKKRKEFHAIGTEAYGPDWDDKRKQLCAAVGVESSNDLTMAQAQKLIDGMRAKLEE